MEQKRILVFGAGVIGSLYACLFAQAGYRVTVYARGQRLRQLKEAGLRYEKNGKIAVSDAQVTGTLDPDETYDFILLAVRENQVKEALRELKAVRGDTIVTMVNTLEDYALWESECGNGRILPAFPGAGGRIEDGILHAKLTPRIIQPTTFAEKNGEKSSRTGELAAVFRRSGIPYQIVRDMHAWQLCHLAMVVPLADAYYMTEDPKHAGKDRRVMDKTARQIKENMKQLTQRGVKIAPKKLILLRDLPVWILRFALSLTYRSRFASVFMYPHSMKAPDEMRRLHGMLYRYLGKEE